MTASWNRDMYDDTLLRLLKDDMIPRRAFRTRRHVAVKLEKRQRFIDHYIQKQSLQP